MRQFLGRIGQQFFAALSDQGAGEAGRAQMQPEHYPRLATGESIYAVGDIHGKLDCLQAVHALIDDDRRRRAPSRTMEIYVGDYVDRGPESAAVIDQLIQRGTQCPCIFLRGNHEQMFEDVLSGQMDLAAWREVGGLETIRSYGVDPRRLAADPQLAPALIHDSVPPAHREFLSALRPMATMAGYIFVHAGLRPGVPLDKQNLLDLLWIREEFTHSDKDFGAIVVHGHTPVEEPELLHNRVNLDTGAYATGRLSFCRIDADGLAVQSVAL